MDKFNKNGSKKKNLVDELNQKQPDKLTGYSLEESKDYLDDTIIFDPSELDIEALENVKAGKTLTEEEKEELRKML